MGKMGAVVGPDVAGQRRKANGAQREQTAPLLEEAGREGHLHEEARAVKYLSGSAVDLLLRRLAAIVRKEGDLWVGGSKTMARLGWATTGRYLSSLMTLAVHAAVWKRNGRP